MGLRRGTRMWMVLSTGVALAGAGCGRGDAGPDGFRGVETRDSAGVRIVENAAGPVDTFVVSAPLLTIGREGDPQYEFDAIRFVGGLSDGRVVVADLGASGARFYSAVGEYLGAVASQGQGPGDFMFVGGAQLIPGDTLAIDDPRLRRVSLIAPDMSFARAISYLSDAGEPPASTGPCILPGYIGLVGTVRPSLALRSWGCAQARGVEGPLRWAHELSLRRLESDEVVSLGTVTLDEGWERPAREGIERFTTSRLAAARLPTAWEEGLVLHSFERHALSLYDADGVHRMEIRDAEPRRAMTAAHRDAWAASEDSARIAYFEGIPFPERLPAFSGTLVGDGRFWARHYDVPGTTGEHWRVYEVDGTRLGVAAFPPGFELRSVRDRRAYGVTVDDLGIQRAQVFELPW